MSLKKFCSCCNNCLIDINEKYCEKCKIKKEKEIKENRKDYFKRYNENRDDIYSFYNSKEWTSIRAVVKQRDMGLCQVCLMKNIIHYMTTVHHIIELKDNYSLRIDENNLISVCSSCHQKIHREYENGTESKQKMIEVLQEIINGK